MRMRITTVYEASRVYEVNFCSEGVTFTTRLEGNLGKIYNRTQHLMRVHEFEEADIVELATGEVLYEFKAEI